MFIYSCGNESNINSKPTLSNSNISKFDSDKKPDQSIALVDFNPGNYDRKCMTDTIGPQKTFEIYQSNKIQENQISEIPQCLMSDSDKKSAQSQTDNNDKKSVGRQTQTFIVFNPSQYSRECIVENLDSQKTFQIYESNTLI